MLLRFLHLPKTGGSSLKLACKDRFGSRAIQDYGNNRHPALVDVDPVADPEKALEILKSLEAKVVMGHDPYHRHAKTVPPDRTFVFLRDPVTQVVSHYHHKRRVNDFAGSLLDFAEDNRNTQTRLLENLPLDEAFVGFFELYDEFVQRLNARFELELPVLVANVNPDKPYEKPYDLDDATRAVLEHLNTDDVRVYDDTLYKFVAEGFTGSKPWTNRRAPKTLWSVAANRLEVQRIRGSVRLR